MCMCSNNSMNHRGCCGGTMATCGASCFSVGPFRGVRPECTIVPNTGSIIPFSSGISGSTITTGATGAAATVSAIGFGSAVSGIVPAANGTITLPLGATTEAFNVPRTGTISAISATFTETTLVTLTPAGSTATITARIYRAPAGSSVFTPTNAFVNLTPTVTGTVAVGTVYQGTTSTNVPVAAGDRLVMVFSVAGTATTLSLAGTATAGITIS